MRALATLIIAGTAAALFSAPVAAQSPTKLDAVRLDVATAQQTCQGWGVRCDTEITPEYCIADDKCAVALPASSLIRYDQRMDALLSQ
jgi:hypothetical protein